MNLRPTDVELAWLAGLMDGEASIGIGGNGNVCNSCSVQLNMTHQPSILRAREVIDAIGCRSCTYTYTEKKSHHRDAHLLTIRRRWDIRLLATEMIRFSVTKHRQWELILEFVSSRLEGTVLDEQKRVIRGGSPGKWWKPFSEREYQLANLIREENRRGKKAAV
jgi:hypothetical protein